MNPSQKSKTPSAMGILPVLLLAIFQASPSKGQPVWKQLSPAGTSTSATVAATASLSGFSSWKGDGGDLWVFSGMGYGADSSFRPQEGLWHFHVESGSWERLPTGSASPEPRMNALTWRVGEALWLYGGQDINGVEAFEDLWKYDLSLRTWANVLQAGGPGLLSGSVTWTDAQGRLWLFGGQRPLGGTNGRADYRNAVWHFDTQLDQWTQVPQNDAQPTGRAYAASWLPDSSATVWVYGGIGTDSTGGQVGSLGDMLAYNPPANRWVNIPGGAMGMDAAPSAAQGPGSRTRPVYWSNGGTLYLQGGHNRFGKEESVTDRTLWAFSTASGEWITVPTANTVPHIGQGTATVDAGGNPILFGGIKLEGGNPVPKINTSIWKLTEK